MNIFYILFPLAIAVVAIAGVWKTFEKAGKPGWAAIVPIYSFIVMLEIVEKPLWWVVLLIIPLVNLAIAAIVSIELAKKFGQETGFGIGLLLLPIVFYCMLGFGDYEYQGGPTESLI